MLITENQLDVWVRGNARDAQGVIVELVWRLVAASSPNPRERRFPLPDSIGQHGPDGILDAVLSFDPFVPEDRSFWEIGTGVNAREKATSDYNDLVRDIPQSVRICSTFIFVTPLSALRDWPHTWRPEGQATWVEERCSTGDWKDVRVIDGTKLIDWMSHFPSVESWLAQNITGVPAVQYFENPEERWNLIKSIGEPPPLIPDVFLGNRDEACTKINEVFAGTTVRLKLKTHFPDQVVSFVSAYLASLDEESRADITGRCLIVSGVEGWNIIVAQQEKHILIAESPLDLNGEMGTKLIQKAKMSGHAIIFGGAPGGIPDPASARLPEPRNHQVKGALEKAGYSEERARTLAQKSEGNLGSLLRCIQNLSEMPEWAMGAEAAELAIAEALGAWDENLVADCEVVESIAGKTFGEWIGKIREIALHPGTPLTQRDGKWRFIARYEGWYALGPMLFNDHLDRFKNAAILVLQEEDPQFELPKEERYSAQIYGKVPKHSRILRNGIAESLALLGNHPKALTSCTFGKAEETAVLSVRSILSDADWCRWGSLNDLLPLLAEAAPNEFLNAVEEALNKDSCPFDELFVQESGGIIGRTYITGLLWALETLAWDPDYLSRVVMCLGELAARDPGGQWSNRPANSLTTVLLPWLPQTCAPFTKRRAAVDALLTELPEIGWNLLLSLLPQYHSTSSYTSKPVWRETIPQDWTEGVTNAERHEQETAYAKTAVAIAKGDPGKLAKLIDYIENMPQRALEYLMDYLGSEDLRQMPEINRALIWSELVDLVTKHRRFPDARWAMNSGQIERLSVLSEHLKPEAPNLSHQRLFRERDFDLYEENRDFNEQRDEFEHRRQRAIEEIVSVGGVQAVMDFASTVESPWRVGIAFGAIATREADGLILPSLLESEIKSLAQFVGGFVRGRFHSRSWSWVDGIDTSLWIPSQIGQYLSFLPFAPETWERAERLLGSDQSAYWSITSANPYGVEVGLEAAIDQLIQSGRPYAAIGCLYHMVLGRQLFDNGIAVRALLAALHSAEGTHSMVSHEMIEIIKVLQDDSSISADDLFSIEWAYLSLLDGHRGATPKLLWRKLANEPEFFCEVIRLVFQSEKEDQPIEEPTEDTKRIASNAYRLLSDWRKPPGCHEDGTYDGDRLTSWLDAVKEECSSTGHLAIAMEMIGHVLKYVPPDPDGLWIHRSAAKVLNERNAQDMRSGFRTEIFNSRGVYGYSEGREEHALSVHYGEKANSVESAGFPRLAATLREVASSYERGAVRESQRNPFDDH